MLLFPWAWAPGAHKSALGLFPCLFLIKYLFAFCGRGFNSCEVQLRKCYFASLKLHLYSSLTCIKTHNLPTLSSGLIFLKTIPDFALFFCLMLLVVHWEFGSVTQLLGYQYFSLLLWLFVWFCVTFWLCRGWLLGFGNPRDIIFPLTAFSC